MGYICLMERGTNTSTEERIVRVALPVELIVRMDRLLSRRTSGFTTRQQLIREALENQLLELSHEEAPPEPAALQGLTTSQVEGPADMDQGEGMAALTGHGTGASAITLENLAATTITPLERGWAMEAPIEMRVDDGPLLGLHNRDYPSLWALRRLGEHCYDGPASWDAVLTEITVEAWAYGGALRELELREGVRGLTALFPVNHEKPAAAERGFRSFAIGSARPPSPDTPLRVSGPLLTWRTCGLVWDGSQLQAGLTNEGWSMLDAIAGISLAVPPVPHEQQYARAFLEHLRQHAPGDHGAFVLTLRSVSEGPDRPHLVKTFAERFGGTAAVAGSLAQGYVARAREWGLVEPKLVDGRYWLTAFGRTLHQEIAT